MADYHLAQLNIAHMRASLDMPLMADFVGNLERINSLADHAPGFVWRLVTEEGDATSIRAFGEDHIVNLSLWRDLDSLQNFVFRTAHIEIMRRRKEWFEKMHEAYAALWWVPAGDIPTVDDAKVRLTRIRDDGPTANAFNFKKAFPPPG